MKNISIWQKEIKPQNKEGKKLNINTDILIIGGGLTGVTLAYLLKDENKKVTLIDKSIVGCGVTSKTTAKITYLQGIIYQTLEKNFNEEVAKKYYESQKEAISNLKNIIEKNKISCDFEQADSIIFTLEEKGISKIEKEKQILNKYGVGVKDVIHPKIKAGIKVEDTYIFHPLKYINGIKKVIQDKIDIFENVTAENMTYYQDKYEIKTNRGTIYTKTIVFACHYPFFLFPTLIPFKTYIKREYVNAAKVKDPQRFTAISIDKKLHSIRFYKNYLIYGSNEQKLTNHIDYKKNYDKSKSDFIKYFKKEPEFTWMNQDIVSNDSLPFIGEVKKNVYLATAYNAWGMTNATLAAFMIKNLLLQKENKYAEIFDPKRANKTLFYSSLLGSFFYLKAYTQSMFQKNNPYYIKIKGIRHGVYKDEQEKTHFIKLICPHLKCGLVFNKEENTWDCPCHGSRFNLDGKLLEGPATKSIEEKM